MKLSKSQAAIINNGILICGTLGGLLHPQPKVYYRAAFDMLLLILAFFIPCCIIIQLLGRYFGKYIQTDAKPPKYLQECIQTFVCFYTTALMAGWVLAKYRTGDLTAYVWKIEDSFVGPSILANIGFAIFFFLIVDLATYTKHWSLHTPLLFALHENHHQFSNPSVWASFSVSPAESVWTFGLLLFDMLPIANQYKLFFPLHVAYIIAFAILNVYLHCGYTFDIIENTLPKLFINTSGYHNLHHAKTTIHIAELLTFWDLILNNGATYYNQKQFADKLLRIQENKQKQGQ